MNNEETIENPEEVETSETETTDEVQETSENPESSKEEVEAQRDRLYARLKKEEERRKELEVKLSKSKNAPTEDLAELAGKMRALSGLDAAESERVIKESKVQGSSLGDARKSQDFKFWRSSYRAELEKSKSPEPSTRQNISEAEKPYSQMTPAEFEKAAVEGLNIIDAKTGKVNKVSLLDRGLRQRLEERYKGGQGA